MKMSHKTYFPLKTQNSFLMPRDIITEADEAVITQAIEEAEGNTSGEIRVHIEDTCTGEVLDRATQVFAYLHMHQTKLRNGVLFYVALKSHKFAVLGDAGINAVVPKNFWVEINQQVISDFKQGNYAQGLSKGIRMAGEQLKSYFPYAGDHKDINELPNDISFGSHLNKDQQT
jgi:uncharacterized membrane protein